MLIRPLIRAVSLPLAAILLMAISIIGGNLVASVTETKIWVAGDVESVRNKLRESSSGTRFRVNEIEHLHESELTDSTCSSASVELSYDTPSYRDVNAEWMHALLLENGLHVCGGPKFTFGRDALLSEEWSGWPSLLMLFMSAWIVGGIYRHRVAVSFSQRRHGKNFALGLLAGMAMVGMWLAREWAYSGAVVLDTGLEYEPQQSIAMLIALVVFIPFIEETAFRAWFIPRTSESVGIFTAAVLSAGLFSIVHGIQEFEGLLFYFGLGAILSFLWCRTTSLLSCVVAHCGYNSWIAVSGMIA